MATQKKMNKMILAAARTGDGYTLQDCINTGAEINCQDIDYNGQTPLHWVAWVGRTEVVDLLLKSGASLSLVNYKGETPLHTAAVYGKTKIVALLLRSGASLSVVDYDGQTPLHSAAGYGRTEVVDLLLKSGASLSVVTKKGETPLHTAAVYGKTKIVALLLRSGASLSVVDYDGQTPLHSAAWYGRTEVVDLLLKSGASLSVVTNKGQTPLHIAVMYKQTKVVELLLRRRASLSVVDNAGKTPHDLAHDHERKLLEKYAASTADMVHQFSMMSTAEEVKELIAKGEFMAYENRIYLAGASNVGKSTLASILLGKEIPQIWKSTNGLIIYFGMNGIHLKDRTMIPLEKGFHGDVLSKVLRGQPDMKQRKHPSKYGKSLLKIEKKERPHSATKEEMTSVKHPAVESKPMLSVKTDTALVKGARKEDTHKELSKPQLQAEKMPEQSYITIHEDIKEEIRKGNYKVNIAPSDLVDFGGQKSFDMTHQLFIQRKGEFILMFDGRFHLRDPQQGDTTESTLKHWVTSIFSYYVDDDDIVPIILFAATHSDNYCQKDRIDRKERFIKDLKEMFQNHEQHKRIKYEDIFFINGTDKNDPEINRLKTKLVDVAFQQKSWGERMPMAWVPLDLQFSKMRVLNTTLISKEDLTALNRSNGDLALTDTQIDHFLNVQHSLGKILYFDQRGLDKFIIVQPQSLVNILRSFITDKVFWPQDISLRNILLKMINTGEIAQKDLLKLWSQDEFNKQMPKKEYKTFIIQVLVHLDILVKQKRYCQEQKCIVQSYLVPCMVQSKLPVTNVDYKSRKDNMICLSYRLLKSSIPAALSFKLIGAAMNVWPLKETSEGVVCLYHQAAILCIDGANELHISVKDNKINIYLINKTNKRCIPPRIASTVQECLTLTLKNVLEFYHKSFGKSLPASKVSNLFEIEVGEWCDTGACYISVPEGKPMLEWTCENKNTHETKFPLFWIYVNTQDTCGENCRGLDKKGLTLCPSDLHLVRLAGIVPVDTFYKLVIHLGLSDNSWNTILKDYRGYGLKVVNFVALYECRQQKNKQMMKISFKDLYDALAEVGHNQHVLCQVLNVYCKDDANIWAIDNIALQQNPEEEVLRQLSNEVGNCAMQLGVELGLRMVEIEQTLFEYPKVFFNRTFDILKKWKENSEIKPTIRILMNAMQASDPRGLAFLADYFRLYSSTKNTAD